MNNLQEPQDFHYPFRSQFWSGLNRTLQDYLSRLRTVGGPVFIPWMVFPQLWFLFWGRFRTVLVCSLYGAVAGTIFRIITELGVFVVQGWTGDMATGVEWSGPTGIMTACRR